jgi:8-oxo-dGTP pyrophosphatase MutT (NUDIX family)
MHISSRFGLVVIYAEDTKRVLMLQRRDDPDFWQSVTGSLEEGVRIASRRA